MRWLTLIGCFVAGSVVGFLLTAIHAGARIQELAALVEFYKNKTETLYREDRRTH